MAAAAACLAGGVDRDAVAEGLRTFAGVAHRLEELGTIDGVRYVNDSKATNVDSTLVALAAFDGGVHLILGGRPKAQDFTPLAAPVAERCRAVYLIGEAAEEIERTLVATGVEMVRAQTLESAVQRAASAAAPRETVLLSPACASFDQFSDFEARGDAFRALVTALR
jgi:UDP-N-acetylmuramoylalanine--D-glutamate ligase